MRLLLVFLFSFAPAAYSAEDWPMSRGNAARSGLDFTNLRLPLSLAWAAEFSGERIGAAVEPIVAHGLAFVPTHAGNLYALNAENGEPIWRYSGDAPFLNSPSVSDGLVIAASSNGRVVALKTASGDVAWKTDFSHAGFSASPLVFNGKVFVGSREGAMLILNATNCSTVGSIRGDAIIRQTAAAAGNRVVWTDESLRVHCLDAPTHQLLWTSKPLPGQSARDYYPVIAKTSRGHYVLVRTNPALGMAQRIGRDRTLLCRNAGVNDSGWEKVDKWIKSDQARGTPELWAREQSAILSWLQQNPDAQSLFVLDLQTGKRTATPPVLWAAGCQAVGAPPTLTPDGRVLVFYRSAYGNWNHGVAPLVALGLLDLDSSHITPLLHQQGNQPPWNTFWGTADESQNFVVAGNTILIVHQGTLSAFDLVSSNLFHIHGERDTYGGFRTPPWARNEWHGPARSGVAIAGSNVYWQTGSRILCLRNQPKKPVSMRTINGETVKTTRAGLRPLRPLDELRAELVRSVQQR